MSRKPNRYMGGIINNVEYNLLYKLRNKTQEELDTFGRKFLLKMMPRVTHIRWRENTKEKYRTISILRKERENRLKLLSVDQLLTHIGYYKGATNE